MVLLDMDIIHIFLFSFSFSLLLEPVTNVLIIVTNEPPLTMLPPIALAAEEGFRYTIANPLRIPINAIINPKIVPRDELRAASIKLPITRLPS